MKISRYIPLASCLFTVFIIGQPDAAAKGPDGPVAYLVSDAHLDTQWNWDLQTTIRDYVWNTVNRNLNLFDKYPEYIFNFEGGIKYAWMKEYYPREYELVKKRIAEGRWHVSGASWDATDAIVPSVESAIRNILLGQTFYRDEFGVESTDIFLPDCFGFGWTLPTVASHCGLIGFSSQKLGWRNNPFYGDRKIPFPIGLWQGVDSARIMMAHGYDYTTRWGNEDLTASQLLAQRASESPLNMVYHYYGTGDVGGSPTQTSVAAVARAVNGSGKIKIISAASDKLYKDFAPYSDHPELPVFDGELTMDVHGTGCYTSQAAMKLYNRQNELLGDAAERAAVAAEMLAGVNYPGDALTDSWRRFIFHQFHDDLTGTSIPRAYEFSWNDELISLKQFSDVLRASTCAVAEKMDTRVSGIPVVLFNALGDYVSDIVELALPADRCPAKVTVIDATGQNRDAQVTGYENGTVYIVAEANAPANGGMIADVRLSGKGSLPEPQAANTVENSKYRITVDSNGDIVSLIDKDCDRELVKAGKAIRLALFEDNKSYSWPAWEILKGTLEQTPVSITGNVTVTLVEKGPLRHTLCIEKDYNDSKFRQYIRLYEGASSARIDFYNEVDWATGNALLKAEFPLAIENTAATYDLGLGTIKRNNNTPTAYEVYAQRWADLTDRDGEYGVTIMNDCKYGWDKPDDNTLRLTLLHTPATENNFTYQSRQDFGHHTFTYSLYPHAGPLDKTKASKEADILNQQIKAFMTVKHSGELGKSFSLAQSDNPSIAIKAFKKAEKSEEYVIRIYETSGRKSQAGKIKFPYPIKSAVAADGTEKTLAPASFNGNNLDVSVVKNGIRTYKVTFDMPPTGRVDDFVMLSLPFDKRCFSLNAFESDADFSEGFSYAAELIPDTIVSSGIPFRPETKALLNGKKCTGDTLILPEGQYGRLYILAASSIESGSAKGSICAGSSCTTIEVPSYSEFIGQWGHNGHTDGYLKNDEIAYIGTHRHAPDGDCPYEFTYMFKYNIDLPKNTRQVILPDNPDIVIFAATLSAEAPEKFFAVSELFRTSIVNKSSARDSRAKTDGKSLVNAGNMVAWSGYVNEKERPEFLHDGNPSTKWCDTSGIPSYVDYDLGEPREISGWSMTGAAIENPAYITSTCLLQTRNSVDEDWRTADAMFANKKNTVRRMLKAPVAARYVRLLVVQPEQLSEGNATRIYEFSVY